MAIKLIGKNMQYMDSLRRIESQLSTLPPAEVRIQLAEVRHSIRHQPIVNPEIQACFDRALKLIESTMCSPVSKVKQGKYELQQLSNEASSLCLYILKGKGTLATENKEIPLQPGMLVGLTSAQQCALKEASSLAYVALKAKELPPRDPFIFSFEKAEIYPQFSLDQKTEVQLAVLQNSAYQIGMPDFPSSVSEVIVAPGATWDLCLLKESHSVILVVEGESQMYVDSESFSLKEGHYAEILPNQQYMIKNLQGDKNLKLLVVNTPCWTMEQECLYREFDKFQLP